MGKTNLLDAIYYSCFTRSYFAPTDALNIGFGKDGFRLESYFNNSAASHKIVCIHRGGTRKEFYHNEVAYERFSKHIGLLPAVMIAPDDVEIVTGSSELRRKLMDTVLSQLDPEYLQQLIIYNKVLQQRNSLLKRFAEQGRTDEALLDVLDGQLLAPGKIIYEKRLHFTNRFLPLVHAFYQQIANAPGEIIELQYESALRETTFESLLQKSRERDRFLQRTHAGIHRDDLVFGLSEQSFRQIASQGQRKSLLFALKLAEYEIIRQEKGFSPLLLLDDVFEKLDDHRMNNLLHYVCIQNKGQVFITDTHRKRLEEVFKRLGVEAGIFELPVEQ